MTFADNNHQRESASPSVALRGLGATTADRLSDALLTARRAAIFAAGRCVEPVLSLPLDFCRSGRPKRQAESIKQHTVHSGERLGAQWCLLFVTHFKSTET
jgi:hypothetical protein